MLQIHRAGEKLFVDFAGMRRQFHYWLPSDCRSKMIDRLIRPIKLRTCLEQT